MSLACPKSIKTNTIKQRKKSLLLESALPVEQIYQVVTWCLAEKTKLTKNIVMNVFLYFPRVIEKWLKACVRCVSWGHAGLGFGCQPLSACLASVLADLWAWVPELAVSLTGTGHILEAAWQAAPSAFSVGGLRQPATR